jgi:membrane protein DedA with SNARE-associated domain
LGSDLIVARLGYLGIILVLVLGGLGLPVPEEAPILLAAVLSRNGRMFWPVALASCFLGVLAGDFVFYALGYFQGERVLSFPITRRFLSREREAQIKGYFHRHGIRILITGRFVPGFRTAAYLTAGILRLPPMRLFLADLCAATMSTLLMFGLGYFFTQWIETRWKQAQGYAVVAAGLGVAGFLLYRHYKAQKRGGAVVGPPVPVSDEVPVPVDDLRSGILRRPKPGTPAAIPPPAEPPPGVFRADTATTERDVEPAMPAEAPAPVLSEADGGAAPRAVVAIASESGATPDRPGPRADGPAENGSRGLATPGPVGL